MDKDFREGLKNFEAVWQRVQKAKAPAQSPPQKQKPQNRRTQQSRNNRGRGRGGRF